MTNILFLGYGYVAQSLVQRIKANDMPDSIADVLGTARLFATYRKQGASFDLMQEHGVQPIDFAAPLPSPEEGRELPRWDIVICSIPPVLAEAEKSGASPIVCPALQWLQATQHARPASPASATSNTPLRQTTAATNPPPTIIYLSTTGVYGDHRGEWVNEQSPSHNPVPRSRARLVAEEQWQEHFPQAWVLRLAGIYGATRNPFRRLRQNKAVAIEKIGYVSGRIHVTDIASSILAAIVHDHQVASTKAEGAQESTPAKDNPRVVNVVDDLPASPARVMRYAATIGGYPPPRTVPYAEAAADGTLTPMAASFYAQCRRVQNKRLHRLLAEAGMRLRYRDYRAGLRTIWDAAG
ncbi:MAG: sugar nucleotide-binding protein [Alphaproteobacteria bacterium]|nr:sugar nucleotide-binding protein [Alphaproteobacteria bacterium]